MDIRIYKIMQDDIREEGYDFEATLQKAWDEGYDIVMNVGNVYTVNPKYELKGEADYHVGTVNPLFAIITQFIGLQKKGKVETEA